jgi:mono/diheme cytochrome c family protein
MCKSCWTIVVVLLLLIGGGVYKFMFQGAVEQSSDGRTAIMLDEGERDLVLAEMRAFLATAQQITAAVASDNIEAVAASARAVGHAAQQAVPGTLMGKLPMPFKKMGMDTHTKFDELAADAEQLGDGNHALGQLSTVMQNCVACHAAYRIELAPK